MNEKTLDTNAPTGDAKKAESWGSFALFMLKLAVVVLIFRSFVFSPFSIPSESMLPRLWKGDYLLAAKWPYGFSGYSLPFGGEIFSGRFLADQPERGDVVIFKHPIDKVDYIKRVIGLPGDTIAVSGGRVILNGEPLATTRLNDFIVPLSPNTGCASGGMIERAANGSAQCRYARFREVLPSGKGYEVLDFGLTDADERAAIIVPEGRLFVMGDNRDNSQDSRFPAEAGGGVGLIPQENLVGQASVIMWSTDGSAEWLLPWTWISAARWGRIGDLL
ncbi:MAG: S26 family signal peptidase [Sphingomonadales bacterium BRH_c42]|nr:MAG: S26 family signal peptidase [Sphingomonadales bacterium BRH_c42]